MLGQYLEVDHDHVLSYPFLFIIHSYCTIQHYVTRTFEEMSLNNPKNVKNAGLTG